MLNIAEIQFFTDKNGYAYEIILKIVFICL